MSSCRSASPSISAISACPSANLNIHRYLLFLAAAMSVFSVSTGAVVVSLAPRMANSFVCWADCSSSPECIACMSLIFLYRTCLVFILLLHTHFSNTVLSCSPWVKNYRSDADMVRVLSRSLSLSMYLSLCLSLSLPLSLGLSIHLSRSLTLSLSLSRSFSLYGTNCFVVSRAHSSSSPESLHIALLCVIASLFLSQPCLTIWCLAQVIVKVNVHKSWFVCLSLSLSLSPLSLSSLSRCCAVWSDETYMSGGD